MYHVLSTRDQRALCGTIPSHFDPRRDLTPDLRADGGRATLLLFDQVIYSMSSVCSPSPPSSTSTSGEEAPLPRLVSHYLSAKRSLHSTALVYRANELVTQSRHLVTELAVLRAKNSFLNKGIGEQLNVLRAVQGGVEDVLVKGKEEFQCLLRDLDAADASLQQTIRVLRETKVEPAFNPGITEGKSLHDFVDDEATENLTLAIRGCIDNVNAATDDLGASNASFGDAVAKIDDRVNAIHGVSARDETFQEDVPDTFRALENHAAESASLLQSLVTHYDLCITALKHTEGGRKAASDAVTGSDMELAPESSGSLKLDNLSDQYIVPMNEEEKLEMMTVLDNDAKEVDDVVQEIKDRSDDMENRHAQISEHVRSLRVEFMGLKQAISMLEEIGSEIPTFVSAATLFLQRWEEERLAILSKLAELHGLREFYEGFIGAYEGLLVESVRRANVRKKMEALMHNAMAEMNELYATDLREREAFTAEQGEFLPSDIWPALVDPPARFRWIEEKYERVGVGDNSTQRISERSR